MSTANQQFPLSRPYKGQTQGQTEMYKKHLIALALLIHGHGAYWEHFQIYLMYVLYFVCDFYWLTVMPAGNVKSVLTSGPTRALYILHTRANGERLYQAKAWSTTTHAITISQLASLITSFLFLFLSEKRKYSNKGMNFQLKMLRAFLNHLNVNVNFLWENKALKLLCKLVVYVGLSVRKIVFNS